MSHANQTDPRLSLVRMGQRVPRDAWKTVDGIEPGEPMLDMALDHVEDAIDRKSDRAAEASACERTFNHLRLLSPIRSCCPSQTLGSARCPRQAAQNLSRYDAYERDFHGECSISQRVFSIQSSIYGGRRQDWDERYANLVLADYRAEQWQSGRDRAHLQVNSKVAHVDERAAGWRDSDRNLGVQL